jgi:hypothetical protein
LFHGGSADSGSQTSSGAVEWITADIQAESREGPSMMVINDGAVRAVLSSARGVVIHFFWVVIYNVKQHVL